MNTIHTMKEVLDYAARTYGENPAFRYKQKKEIINKTYRQLKEDSESVSRTLADLGMQGAHVAVIGPTTYEWVISYFGTANSGNVIVPLDVLLPAEAVVELLNRADVSVLIYDELRKDVASLAREKCPQIKYMISMQAKELPKDTFASSPDIRDSLDTASEDAKEAMDKSQQTEGSALSLWGLLEKNRGDFTCELDADAMCAILFTSGTTGKSKGVMLTHRSLTDNAVCLDMRIPTGAVSMTLLPVHHAYCFTMDILKGIYIGLVICINDSIMHVSKNMKLFQPEIILLVPMVIESIYKKLTESGGILPKKMVAKAAFGGKLKTICSGGAYLSPEMVKAFAEYGITILQGYGMTECSPVISTNLAWQNKIGSVGKLLPNCEAKVVEEEIWVRGSSVMLGYYKMPQETGEALVDGWLRTGDLGYVDEDGFVFITGRKKNLIILKNGENVSPEELENEICKDPLIKEIIVREAESVIEAEIFPDLDYAKKKRIKDVPGRLQEIVDDYNKGLPPYKRVHGLKIRDEEFEKTPSKKIKRT